MDDINVREYLESRMGDPDSDDDNDFQLQRLTPEPTNDQIQTEVNESSEPAEEDNQVKISFVLHRMSE